MRSRYALRVSDSRHSDDFRHITKTVKTHFGAIGHLHDGLTGGEPMVDYQRLKSDILSLGLLAAALFLGISLFSYDPIDPPAHTVFPAPVTIHNLGGPVGAWLSHLLFTAFGFGAYVVLFGVVCWDLRLFSKHESTLHWSESLGLACLLLAGCVLLQSWLNKLGTGPIVGTGGYLGALATLWMEKSLSPIGTGILLATLVVTGALLTDNLLYLSRWTMYAFWPLRGVYAGLSTAIRFPLSLSLPKLPEREKDDIDRKLESILDEVDEDLEETAEAGEQDELEDPFDEETEEEPLSAARPVFKVNPPVIARPAAPASWGAGTKRGDDEFQLPEVDLLDDAEDFPYELLAKKAQVAALTLEKTFQEFGLNVKVSEIDTGPVITQFELELEPGLRLSKVTALADDLAIALRVPAVRVVAPIPGKNTVGIEVPNEKRVMVRLRELIESCPEATQKMRIPVFLGKDVSGHPLAVDLAKMPHLLIAGRTGTGKSVCLNSLVLSILMTRTPDEVKMLMIDPKMVELSCYKRVPHLMHPVITDMKKAEAVLAWAVDKMEERYDLLARCGVRHLDGYNKLGKEEVLNRAGIDPESPDAEQIPDSMPYIVIIADEMADMMMTSGKDVEGHIIRLAQKSRAVGIHLVLATQKPTVDVITGLIKSNLPARISFQVASRTDSRVVLDEMGAERLLGNGDMLYLMPGTSNIVRSQGTYVSDDEIFDVVESFADYEPDYSPELAQLSASGSLKAGGESNRSRDDLYDQAVEVILREGRGSVSLLQRALGVGYGRGARLIDYMAEDGIVGDYNGSQAREVLMTLEQWQELQSADSWEAAGV